MRPTRPDRYNAKMVYNVLIILDDVHHKELALCCDGSSLFFDGGTKNIAFLKYQITQYIKIILNESKIFIYKICILLLLHPKQSHNCYYIIKMTVSHTSLPRDSLSLALP